MWMPGQPDCGTYYDTRAESCTGLAKELSFGMNDYSCSVHSLCPLCQLDVD